MKIAITAHGQDSAATIDARFGRAEHFVIYDQDTDCWECLPNTQNLEAAHGAGIQAGQTLIKSGAGVVVTGHVGPKAFKVLDAGKVQVYSFGEMNGTVKDALTAFLDGKLSAVAVPNALDVHK
jgi:predicted Fe-Mo cluster-binding NifX family protein